MNDEQLNQLSCSQENQAKLRKAVTASQEGHAPKKYDVRALTKKMDLFKAALDLGIDLAQYTANSGARKSAPIDGKLFTSDKEVTKGSSHRPVEAIEADISVFDECYKRSLDQLAKVEAIEGIDSAVVDASRASSEKAEHDLSTAITEKADAVKHFAEKAQQARSNLSVAVPAVRDIDWQCAKKVFGLKVKALDGILCPVYVGFDQDVLSAVPAVDPNFFFNYEGGELLRDVLISFGAVYKSGNPANANLWLWGQRGAGKSDMFTQIAGRLNRPLFVTSCHRELTIEQLGGEFDPRSVAQGTGAPVLLTPSFAKGVGTKHAIVVMDEVARVNPTNAVGFNGALESRILNRIDGSSIPFAEGVTIAVTDNTDGTGDPTGQFEAYPQDQSFLDRFRTIINVPFLPESVEAKVLIAKEGVCSPIAKLIVKVMNAFRGASQGAGGHQARGLYPSLRGAFALSFGLREGKAFRRAVMQNLVGSAIPADLEIANVLLDSLCPSDEDVREVLNGTKSDFNN